MKKTPIFLIVLFFMTILIPQVCAQGESVSPEEAAARRTKFVDYAKQCIGKPYARGAIGPNAFDCSGLVFTCSRESIGVQLPRQTKAIYAFCTIIDESEREIGDLVFFKTTGDDTVSHVGIYVGNAQFIHAASDGQNTGVILSSLRENYWKSHYFQTGRFLPASGLERMVDPKSDSASQPTAQTASAGAADSVAANTATAAGASKRGSFLHKIILDASLTFDWNFFTADSFQISPRGGSTMLHAMYDGGTFRPGVGSMICVNAKMGVVQLPIIVSLTLGDYFRFFFRAGHHYRLARTARQKCHGREGIVFSRHPRRVLADALVRSGKNPRFVSAGRALHVFQRHRRIGSVAQKQHRLRAGVFHRRARNLAFGKCALKV